MDILSLLPADTVISGSIGDNWLYFPFRTTAANAKVDIAAVCARHVKEYAAGYHTQTRSSKTAASYRIHDSQECVATVPDFPDVRIVLTMVNHDVRLGFKAVTVEYDCDMVHNWDNDTKEWKAKAEYLRKLADLLDKLAGA